MIPVIDRLTVHKSIWETSETAVAADAARAVADEIAASNVADANDWDADDNDVDEGYCECALGGVESETWDDERDDDDDDCAAVHPDAIVSSLFCTCDSGTKSWLVSQWV